ncbi:hypothetical protein [Acidimangrovimonas sediminis]|uniref:hypothetical protein n=1 Tax=Acidimangrovimonas sediminis TaxID=2056283 RepID=UPI000C8085F0|nr:hypothetical protein [Acidimangrovimonas sediminis]
MATTNTTDPVTSALQQMTAAFQMWQPAAGTAIPRPMDLPAQLFAGYVSDLQQICGDALEQQRALFAEGAMAFTEKMPGLLFTRRPQDLTELQLEAMVAAVEASSRRARIWADLSKRLGDRYAELAHELARELDNAATPGDEKTEEPVSRVRKAG